MPAYSWQNIQRRLKDIRYPIMIEIGVYQGFLSNQLLKNIVNLELFMCDSWSLDTYKDKTIDSASEAAIKDYQDNWEANFAKACKVRGLYWNRSHIIKMKSLEAVNIFENNYFDLIYIDAAHDEQSVEQDIIAWYPKTKMNGWISGHDYGGEYTGVKKAVDKIFGNKAIKDSDFTWFVKKVNDNL